MKFEYGSYNLHTHSYYCGHGVGTIDEYGEEAKKSGLKLLGFTEHCPVPENRWSASRMAYEAIPSYLLDIEQEKKKKKLEILSGFECDYYPEYKNYFQELKEKVDYLIFGVHFLNTPEKKDVSVHNVPMGKRELHIYAKQYIAAIESGLFSFGAHPDVFALKYLEWDAEALSISRDIIQCALAHDLPLEVNGNGLMRGKIQTPSGLRDPYPIDSFWKVVRDEYPQLKIVTNGDCHDPLNFDIFLTLTKQWGKRTDIQFDSALIEEGNLSFCKE